MIMQKSYLEVNLKNFEENLEKIQKYVGNNTIVAPVIKANAYGIGTEKLKDKKKRKNINIVVVATLEEGIKLRNIGYKMQILLLNELLKDEAKKAIQYDLTVGVSDINVLKTLNNEAKKQSKIAKVHIEIDTGMGRVGIKPENAITFLKKAKELNNINIEGIYTHFAVADTDKEYTKTQIDIFNKTITDLENNNLKFKYIHASSSSGILNFRKAKFNMVRPGIILYGYMPNEEMKNILEIKPVTKLVSHVVFVKEIEKGTSISYGRTYIAEGKRKIATIPLGYADGIKRILSNKGRVYINGKYAKIVGRICMDNFMVDVTDIDVKIGDTVYIWDNENISIEEIANLCDTINYEILCTISNRVKRVYI